MKRFIFIATLLLCSFVVANAQFKRQSLTLDLLGDKGFGGVNYEYRFGKSINGMGITAGLGVVYFKVTAYSTTLTDAYNGYDSYAYENIASTKIYAMLLPIMFNYLAGGNNHHLEMGLGLIPFAAESEGNYTSNTETFHAKGSGLGLSGTVLIGYRYQRPQGGFVFKIGINPSFKLPAVDSYFKTPILWPYLGLGFSF